MNDRLYIGIPRAGGKMDMICKFTDVKSYSEPEYAAFNELMSQLARSGNVKQPLPDFRFLGTISDDDVIRNPRRQAIFVGGDLINAKDGDTVFFNGNYYTYTDIGGWIQTGSLVTGRGFNYAKVPYGIFVIKKVIYNDPATIVYWEDGSKTVVKCGEGDKFDPEKGLAMAIAKKSLGNSGNYYNIIKQWLPKEENPVAEMLQESLEKATAFLNKMNGIEPKTEPMTATAIKEVVEQDYVTMTREEIEKAAKEVES